MPSSDLSAISTLSCVRYGWHKALGLGPGQAAHDFWFPNGDRSLAFAVIALASDFAQDAISHVVLGGASVRHQPVCRYTRISPGWIVKPIRLLRAIKAATCSIWAVTVLTQLSFVYQQRGLLDTSSR